MSAEDAWMSLTYLFLVVLMALAWIWFSPWASLVVLVAFTLGQMPEVWEKRPEWVDKLK